MYTLGIYTTHDPLFSAFLLGMTLCGALLMEKVSTWMESKVYVHLWVYKAKYVERSEDNTGPGEWQ